MHSFDLAICVMLRRLNKLYTGIVFLLLGHPRDPKNPTPTLVVVGNGLREADGLVTSLAFCVDYM